MNDVGKVRKILITVLMVVMISGVFAGIAVSGIAVKNSSGDETYSQNVSIQMPDD